MSATAPLTSTVVAALRAATPSATPTATASATPAATPAAAARRATPTGAHRATRHKRNTDPAAPVRPHAKTVRAHLRAAGLRDLVGRITTGSRYCRIEINYTDSENSHAAHRVADALRELWHDGDERVTVLWAGTVTIAVSSWWNTVPNTPAGLQRLAVQETERSEALIAAQRHGKIAAARALTSVRHEPDPDQPRRPWVDGHGRRYTPFEITLY